MRWVLLTVLASCGRLDFMPDAPDASDAGPNGCVAKVASNGDQVCVMRTDGAVWCWTSNAFGQAGDGTLDPHLLPSPTLVIDAMDLASGERSVCAIRRDQSLACWGGNDRGQIGDGTTTNVTVPFTVPLPMGVAEVRLGQYHTCARLVDGTGACWGSNMHGELGAMLPADNAVVPQSAPIGGASMLTVGDEVTCIVRADRSVMCFGNNLHGELGDGTMTSRFTPALVPLADPVVQVAAGCHRHVCAVTTVGEVWCWGENMSGQLGIGAVTPWEVTPMRVSGVSNAVQVAVGGDHSCARTADDQVVCWGLNTVGQLGNASLDQKLVATPVTGLTGKLVQVETYCDGTYVRRDDGTIAGWGGAGLSGIGASVDQIVPVDVPVPCP